MQIWTVRSIAARHGLVVIEDACQAHGASDGGRRAGSLADVACFSFYPGKNLGAYGDAGAIVTSDKAIAARARLLRSYGQSAKNRQDTMGYNRRMDNLQAAVLRVKLRHLDRWNELRKRAARTYDEILANVEGIGLPWRRSFESHVYHLYVITHDRRDELLKHLARLGVSTGLHYPTPVHLQPCFEWLGVGAGSLPVTEMAARRVLSLPMFPEVKPEQVEYVCSLIKDL